MCPHETAPVPVPQTVAPILLQQWTITIAVARLVDIVLDETDMVIALEAHDETTTTTELVTDRLLVALWKTILLPEDATKTPTVAITLPQRIRMPTAGLPMIAGPETSLLVRDLIHEKDMHATTIVVGVTDESPA